MKLLVLCCTLLPLIVPGQYANAQCPLGESTLCAFRRDLDAAAEQAKYARSHKEVSLCTPQHPPGDEPKFAAQYAAHTAVVDDLWRLIRAKDDNDPPLSILFFGPSGTGKTYLPEVLCSVLDRPLEQMDANTHGAESAQTAIFGADQGLEATNKCLLGHFLENPKTCILVDEIDKAPRKVAETFLQALAKGQARVRRPDLVTVDCRRGLFFFTANPGLEVLDQDVICDRGLVNCKHAVSGERMQGHPAVQVMREKFDGPAAQRFTKIYGLGTLRTTDLKKSIDITLTKFAETQCSNADRIIRWTPKFVDDLYDRWMVASEGKVTTHALKTALEDLKLKLQDAVELQQLRATNETMVMAEWPKDKHPLIFAMD